MSAQKSDAPVAAVITLGEVPEPASVAAPSAPEPVEAAEEPGDGKAPEPDAIEPHPRTFKKPPLAPQAPPPAPRWVWRVAGQPERTVVKVGTGDETVWRLDDDHGGILGRTAVPPHNVCQVNADGVEIPFEPEHRPDYVHVDLPPGQVMIFRRKAEQPAGFVEGSGPFRPYHGH